MCSHPTTHSPLMYAHKYMIDGEPLLYDESGVLKITDRFTVYFMTGMSTALFGYKSLLLNCIYIYLFLLLLGFTEGLYGSH